MNDDDQPPQEAPPTAAPGPFGTSAVDPLVYRTADDSPELRPAAAYVPAASLLSIRDTPPPAPSSRSHREWTPPGEAPADAASAAPGHANFEVARAGLLLLLLLLPILAIAAAVVYGISLYQSP